MEQFKVPYRGKNIFAIKKDGKLITVLPITTDKNGVKHKGIIENGEYGWKYTSSELDDESKYTTVWLTERGRVGYCNYLNPDIKWIENLDRNVEPKDDIHRMALDIYEVASGFNEHEKIGRSPETIMDIRRKQLVVALKYLGYSRIDDVKLPLKPSNLYFSLGDIGKGLYDYSNLSFVRSIMNSNIGQYYTSEIPEGMKGEEAARLVSSAEQKVADGIETIQDKDENYEAFRSIDRDYCYDMDKKIPPEDWVAYSKQVRKTAELLLGLNIDLLSPEQRRGLIDLSELQGIDLKDVISNLIDSKEFERACNIEDKFMIAQSDRFMEAVDYMVDGDETVKASTVGFILEALKEKAMRERSIRDGYTKNYTKMSRLYDSSIKGIRIDGLKGVEPIDDK